MAADIKLFDAVGYLGADWAGLQRDMTKAKGLATSGWHDISSGITSINRRIVAGLAVVGGAVVGVGLTLAKMGMDTVESENLFEVAMGSMAADAREWSVELSKSLGLNQYEVRKTVGTFNMMLESMGIGKDRAFEMAKGLTKLSQDMASFYNLKPEEAFEKLQAAISGEIEPLRKLGVSVEVASLQTYALGLGIKKTYEEMDQGERVALRYSLIMDKMSKVHGDLERTGDSATNMWRRFKAMLQETGDSIGLELQPAIQQGIGLLLDMGTAAANFALQNKDVLKGWVEAAVEKFGEWRQAFADWYRDIFEGGMQQVNGQWVQSQSVFEQWKEAHLQGLEEAIERVREFWNEWGETVIWLGEAWVAISMLNFILAPFASLLGGAWKMATALNVAVRAIAATQLAAWAWAVVASFAALYLPLAVLIGAGGLCWYFKDWLMEVANRYLPNTVRWIGDLVDTLWSLYEILSTLTYSGLWDMATGWLKDIVGMGDSGSNYDIPGASRFYQSNSQPAQAKANSTAASTTGAITINVTAPDARAAANAVVEALEAVRRGHNNFGAQAVRP
jgi:hypothetical protein